LVSDNATVFADLAAEVEIPADGTLSRVLYSDDRIRVVVFAFDAGQELTEHTAAAPALVQVVSGRLRLTLGSETTEVGPGSWVHMPAQLPHAVCALEPAVMLLTLLSGTG
jgi:quercetin dioxygenase-like cupin family protein